MDWTTALYALLAGLIVALTLTAVAAMIRCTKGE